MNNQKLEESISNSNMNVAHICIIASSIGDVYLSQNRLPNPATSGISVNEKQNHACYFDRDPSPVRIIIQSISCLLMSINDRYVIKSLCHPRNVYGQLARIKVRRVFKLGISAVQLPAAVSLAESSV